jgi:hypothetical protein
VQQQVQQLEQDCQQQIAKLQEQVTVEQLDELFKSQRLRPFVLDIETDSTIEPDQIAERQSRTEFAAAISPVVQQGVMAMQMAPDLAPFVAESIRYVANGFKLDRSMDEAIDRLAEGWENYQPKEEPGEKEDDPALAQAELLKAQAAMKSAEAGAEKNQLEAQGKQLEMQAKQQEMQLAGQKIPAEIEKLNAEVAKLMAEVAALQGEAALKEREVNLAERTAEGDLALRGEEVGLAKEQAATDREFKGREIGLKGREVEQRGKEIDLGAQHKDAELGLKGRELEAAGPERKANVGLTEAQAFAARNPPEKAAATKKRKLSAKPTGRGPDGRASGWDITED